MHRLRRLVKRTASIALAAALVIGTFGAGTMTAEASETVSIYTDTTYSTGMEGSVLSSASMLTATTGAYPLTAKTAVISGSNVVVTATVTTTPSSDNGIYYLIASDVYQADNDGSQVATASVGGSTVTFTFALNNNSASSNLYKKFTVACYQGGTLTAVSNPIYITNPEAVATHTVARSDGGKKGILPEASNIGYTSYASADIDQITYNVLLGSLVNGSGVTYTYNGKTYTFNASTVGELDYLVPIMNAQGVQVTLILLNNWSGSYTTNIHPLSRNSTSENYYAFNTAEQSGVELIEAVASFLAQRYSGTGHGTVDNWIIGNEINARSPWNYMSSSAGIEYYTAEYVKAFRLFYNGIKSQNANARVYTCVDQEYAVSDNESLHYAGQTFLTYFNSMITATGNIYWDVAVHPYDYPLYDSLPWLQVTTYPTLVNHTQSSAYVTMANIDVFTDLMCSTAMLNPSGEVRSILCSEQGYVSAYGEEIQAAAIVYGYTQALYNQYIDGFILNREQDHAVEVAQGLNFGIRDTSGNTKLAYTWYRDAESSEVLTAASAIIGTNILSLITVR